MKIGKKLVILSIIALAVITCLNYAMSYLLTRAFLTSYAKNASKDFVEYSGYNIEQYIRKTGSLDGIQTSDILKSNSEGEILFSKTKQDKEEDSEDGDKNNIVLSNSTPIYESDDFGQTLKNIVLEDNYGKVLLINGKVSETSYKSLMDAHQITVDGKEFGTLWIMSNENLIGSAMSSEAFKSYFTGSLISIAVIFPFFILFSIWASSKISRYFSGLSSAASSIASGDYKSKVVVNSGDEFEDFASAFNQMAEELEKSQSESSRLQNYIAHELRTPLTIMQSLLDSIEINETNFDKNLQSSLQEEITRMSRLVNDLKQLSGSQNHTLSFNREILYLSDFTSRLSEHIEILNRTSNVNITWNWNGRQDSIIYIDQDRLMQSIVNLIQNALRYTPDKGSISISTGTDEDYVSFMVSDTGEGISNELLDTIFEPFYRVDSPINRKTSGSGLGLSLVKQIALSLGGNISVESKPGTGSKFCLTIPIFKETTY